MSADSNHAYAQDFQAEDEVLLAARARAEGLPAAPIGPGGGAMLRFLAASLDARAVVEIGTGAGVSGVYLMRGMRADGVLTSVDIEPEHQRRARESYTAAGFAPSRYRLISGAALDVLPRLTDGAYDLVLVDGDKEQYPSYVEQAMRLLRIGGVLVVDNALWGGKTADPAARDPKTLAIREVVTGVGADERVVATLVDAADGLLLAVKTAHTAGD